MKIQTVVVSMVLLIVISALLPGISFSLNSSVTSSNNQIQLPEDDQPFGLYKEASHDTKWTTPAFGKGVVQIKDNDGIKKITVAQDVLLSGTDKVYLWVPEDSEVSSLSVRISYHGDYFAIPSGSSIIFTFTDISSTNTGSTISVGWGSSTSQNSVTVEGGHTYLVEVKISVRTSQNITLNVIPSIDITLDGGSDDVYNPNNNINFEEQLGGITVESDGHVVTGPISSCPIQIDDGISYAIKDSSGHFTSNKDGSNLKIKTDDKHDFYIGIDLKDVTSDKKINSVSVIVESTDGSIDQNYTFTGSNGRYVILGSNTFSQGSSPTTTGINAYSGVEVTITVSWVLWNGGNTFVDLFLIQVPNNGEEPS